MSAKPIVNVHDIVERRHELLDEMRNNRLKLLEVTLDGLCSTIHKSLNKCGLQHVLILVDTVDQNIVFSGDVASREMLTKILRSIADQESGRDSGEPLS